MTLTFPSSPRNDVLILGAGFSRALSPGMPMTDQLGDAVLGYLKDRFDSSPGQLSTPIPRSFSNGFFEAWLSGLAEDQPYLWRDENLRHRSTFSLITDYMGEILEDKVRESLPVALSKPWLQPLLATLHARRASVVSFNQDTIVERAVQEANLPSWELREWHRSGGQPIVEWWDITGGIPSPPLQGGWYGRAPLSTFRLWKLHGSTNWFWRPDDRGSASIAAWWLRGQAKGEAAQPDELAARVRLLPGMSAFVVPPASTKSAFYNNAIIETLWRNARTALQRAERVSILGYSLPATDVVTANLLRFTLVDGDAGRSRIAVVNPRGAAVRNRLVTLGVQKARVELVRSVAAFAREYVRQAAIEVAGAFRTPPGRPLAKTALLLVGTSVLDALPVAEVRLDRTSEVVEVVLEDVPLGQPATSTHLRPSSHPRTVGDLKVQIDQSVGANRRIEAIAKSGRRSPVIAATEYITGDAGRQLTWQVLRIASVVDDRALKPHPSWPAGSDWATD